MNTTLATDMDLRRNAMVTRDKMLESALYNYDRSREAYPESLPGEAHRYTCSDEMLREARQYGHFFDESTMRAFKTKVYDLVDERFLVISDRNDWDGRFYRVCWIYQHKPSCDNASHIHKSVEVTETRFSSLAQARKFARELAGLLNLISDIPEEG